MKRKMDKILKKSIEKAADDYAAMAIATFVNGDFSRHAIADAFEAGAKWRVNSVWHDASEKPNRNNKCLVELRIPGRRNPTYKLWTWGLENSFVTRWAYIDDLLPNGKEGV